ncbi:MAG: branched-chain amino acid ABC transporter permease [Deltaproteobacteria bacterium]|nr:branched-chain amino acid ABC transporter permease [Deltaproteobacteria bacterium]MBW2017131.1 branched-chain amino acid ABC transporter permease [Deltaproteobacteria bacterium]MBW2130189.1 branched-chain amino acid ABC transporter permease [Deltaproteobacteria bacterium]MBW2304123.1 branched-chain amino acid ABC transporter permease [Deltaproteobacteria bacterium]
MFWQQFTNWINLGAMYALLAIGYTMVYGIIKLINFAHGEIFMCGAFFSWWMMSSLSLPFPVAALAGIVLASFLGIGIERVAYRPLRQAPRFAVVISVLGMSIFLQNMARIIWGAEFQVYDVDFGLPPLVVGGVIIPFKKIFILATSFTLMVALGLFVKKTSLGKAMRATAADREAAEMMGINSNGVIVLNFAIGSALGAVAGILFAVNYNSIDPYMGFNAGMKAFAAAVMGGIGNIYGAMFGGILLGIFEGVGAAYVSSMYRDAFAFGVLILTLVLRPQGLLGEGGRNE